MKNHIMPSFACVCAGLLAVASAASASPYAAMDEVPVEGGELRLAAPVVAPGASGAHDALRYQFPLERTRVTIDVTGVMAHYTVEQRFANPFTSPIEAVYVFPLGDDAAVSSYQIAIGERVVKGEIQPREEARATYERAKERGHTAGLLEQDEPNVFTQRVANIAPGETVRVRFTYTELLDHRDDGYELVYPMVVGPRFLPGSGQGRAPLGSRAVGDPAVAGARSVAYLPPGARPGHDVEISARIDAGAPLASLGSPSHDIETGDVNATARWARLATKATIPNKDFVLRFQPAGPRTTVGLLTHRTERDGYFTLVVQPKASYRTGDVTPREVIVLIDTSGSMNGAPLRDAGAVAKAIIGTLTDRDTFNAMAFSDNVYEMRTAPIRGDAAGKAAATAWVDGLRAGGGTLMERGMLRSLSTTPGNDRVRMVYLLSDGFVGNDDTILSAVERHLSHNRIFPVGIGSAPNRYLLDRLGEIGRGFTSYVTSAAEAQEVSAALVRRSAYPYLTDVTVDWAGLAVTDITPAVLPDVYAGLPLVLSGRYTAPGTGTITVAATASGRRVEIPLEVELPAYSQREGARLLWARRRIHELMATQYGGVDEPTRRAVTKLGLDFGLVTEFTSFVAVDRTRVVDGSGSARTIEQPVPLPEGVDAGAIGGAQPAQPDGARAGGRSPSAPRAGSGAASRSGRNDTASRAARQSTYRGGGGRSIGGDVDPLTLLIVLGLVPAAWLIRRERRA